MELGFRPLNSAAASMIALYGQCQQLKQAQEIFDSMAESSSIGGAIYNSMVDTFCKCGKIDEANQLYKKMGDQGYAPDAVTISILVYALTKHGINPI